MRVLDETHDSSRYSRTRWHKQGHERVSDRTALPKHTQYKQESASCRKLTERTQKQHLRVLDDQWLDAENNRTHVMWSTAIQFDKWRYIKNWKIMLLWRGVGGWGGVGGGGVIWPKSYITIWPILYHDNNIYHDIVFFFKGFYYIKIFDTISFS